MPLPVMARAVRPAVTPPAPVTVKDRPPQRKPAPRSSSNAAVLAAMRGGEKPMVDPEPRALQNQVGNGAVAAGLRRGPATDPKFAALKQDIQRKKRTVATSHPPPRKEATAAQDAAQPPKDDEVAQGKTANAEKMNQAKPKEFDKAAFITAVEKAIADKAPKNLDEADKFADSNKPAEIKAEVQGQVGEGKTDSAEQIATTTAAPPDTSAAVTKNIVLMAADRPPGTPAPPDPAKAVPDQLPPSATDLSAGPAAVNQQMADAQVTEPQLNNANEPTFTQALNDKKAAEQHSDTAPDQLRKHETAQLRHSTAQANRLGAATMAAITAQRIRTGQQVGAGKTGTKTRDEEKRAQVTAILQTVFDTMKADVEGILTGLDKLVDDQFTRGEKQARDTFTAEHKRKMDEYKDRRYSGATGLYRWGRDKLLGLPDEANQIFVEARDNYVRRMRQVIADVATTIGSELNRAKQRIAKGRTDLHTEIKKLPADLQAIGKQAAAEFANKFDELTPTVDDKGTQLVDTLATKYTDAVKSIDDEIAAEKEKNKGLAAKAMDAVKGVINTILELKRLLLGVLAKAAQAVTAILNAPIEFLRNLITAVGGGLKLFAKNAGRHLQQGVLAWLLGTTATAGIQLPTTFDILGILVMIAGLLGLTWPNIRARLARKVPDQAITAAETAVPLVAETRKRGVAGMWTDLKTRIGDLKKDLISNLVSYLLPTIIIAGITWIISLFNPASAFIRACKTIIDIIRFITTQGRQIIEFVNTVLDAVLAIARGGTGGVPELIERALARSIPVLIGALAAILGIGGIANKVRQIFQQLARPVNHAIDWAINKIVGLVKKLWIKIKSRLDRRKVQPKKPRKPLLARVKARVRGGDDTPAGQRKRLAAALATGVRAVNRFRGRPVAGKILEPLLVAIRIRYGLDVLRPVVKDAHWAVYGRINPEGSKGSDVKAEGDQPTTANPNFTEDAKEFERKLAAKAATHRAANSALATMAVKAKTYIEAKAARRWDRADAQLAELLMEAGKDVKSADAEFVKILQSIGQDRVMNTGFVGTAVTDVMNVFDRGTLTERFVHIIGFFTGILGKDLMDEGKEAEVERRIKEVKLNITFLSARRTEMREMQARELDPATVERAIARNLRGSDVEHQRRARKPIRYLKRKRDKRDPTLQLGLTIEETGFRFSARQLRMHRRIDEHWDRSMVLRWEAGTKAWRIDGRSKWVKMQRQLGLPLGAGPSGTTNTMMSAAEALGAKSYPTRLACIAFLVGHNTIR